MASKQATRRSTGSQGASGNDSGLHRPAVRRLRIYAFDPSLDLDLETMSVNRSVVRVRWEEVEEGPVGVYVEVVDVDPASGCVYQPIDLDQPHLLAQDGLPPSEGSPRFHQQMVYAVAMITIDNFERALGRSIQWSERGPDEETGKYPKREDAYVPRLRIYPHALREPNAYYSPYKKALLFGYFNAQNADPREGLPGGMVFTCLSHDVIAHEMAHAVLDGIHPRLLEATNPDALAFHEAFADVVAIFQHFTLPGVLEQQIRQTRGDLATENLLAKLAIQFGHSTGRGNALRDALGKVDRATGEWRRQDPDPDRIDGTHEPHARGALLVAAVFDAFLTIYQHHTADLRRIATGGTGVLPKGALHPDLVARFAAEASKAAGRILKICIRALDYLPPVDVTFGDYVRAVITGDVDTVPDDSENYRVALISAFRDWGIFPRDVRTLSVESLYWHPPTEREHAILDRLLPRLDVLRMMATAHDYVWVEKTGEGSRSAEDLGDELVCAYARLHGGAGNEPDGRIAEQRRKQFLRERQFAGILHAILSERASTAGLDGAEWETVEWVTGLDLRDPELRFEVHAVRTVYRERPDARTRPELLVMLTQRQVKQLQPDSPEAGEAPLDYGFRGGCTVLIDPTSGRIRYAISKNINSPKRQNRQERFYRQRLRREGLSARARYALWRKGDERIRQEPFAPLHRGDALEEWT